MKFHLQSVTETAFGDILLVEFNVAIYFCNKNFKQLTIIQNGAFSDVFAYKDKAFAYQVYQPSTHPKHRIHCITKNETYWVVDEVITLNVAPPGGSDRGSPGRLTLPMYINLRYSQIV